MTIAREYRYRSLPQLSAVNGREPFSSPARHLHVIYHRWRLFGALTISIVLLALAACGGGGGAPATVRVHGSFAVGAFSNCRDLELEGAQVTITSASGTVLATATLPLKPSPGKLDGLDVDYFRYSATVSSEARYGVSVAGISPYYATQAQFVKGIDLSC